MNAADLSPVLGSNGELAQRVFREVSRRPAAQLGFTGLVIPWPGR
jgi:hypothetical protein